MSKMKENVLDRILPPSEQEPFTDEDIEGQIAGYGELIPYKVETDLMLNISII